MCTGRMHCSLLEKMMSASLTRVCIPRTDNCAPLCHASSTTAPRRPLLCSSRSVEPTTLGRLLSRILLQVYQSLSCETSLPQHHPELSSTQRAAGQAEEGGLIMFKQLSVCACEVEWFKPFRPCWLTQGVRDAKLHHMCATWVCAASTTFLARTCRRVRAWSHKVKGMSTTMLGSA